MAAIVLAMMCSGCGSSVPDEGASRQSSATTRIDHGAKSSALPAWSGDSLTEHGKKLVGKTDQSALVSQSHDLNPPSVSSIPHAVSHDLASPDARTRLRALEYWEHNDGNVPLDAVFEAIEDEDEAVRARATTIIEHRWDNEQEKQPE